jgi:hypothetical protein
MRMAHLFQTTGLLVLLLCIGSGCGGGSSSGAPYAHPLLTSDNAYEGEIPASAQYLPPETFGSWLDQGRLALVTKADLLQQQADTLLELEEQKTLAVELFRSRPEVLARHTVTPHDGHPDFAATPNGNWLFHMNGGESVELSGLVYAYRDLVEATQSFQTKANQLAVYEEFVSRLDPQYVTDSGLPSLTEVAKYTYQQILDLNATIASDWPAFAPVPTGGKPPGYPASVMEEEGYGGNIDDAGFASRTGIADLVDFPLKWFDTSVKRQGRRGSCVAFGITAAVEVSIARDLGRWVNLSEQMLYNRAKQKWSPSNYGDGYSTGLMLAYMGANAYRYSWEATWDYNPSVYRLEFEPAGLYLASCWDKDDGSVLYQGEHCSDTNHQAPLYTTIVGGLSFTAILDPESSVPPDAGFRTGAGISIGDPGVIGPTWAMALLALDVPVIISVTVPSFGMVGEIVAANDFIVPYSTIEPAGTGGHCMLLIGFVPNSALPPGTPPSPGVGYFICKNSWGWWYGDGGYIYLSDTWVMRWARSLHTLSGVYQN